MVGPSRFRLINIMIIPDTDRMRARNRSKFRIVSTEDCMFSIGKVYQLDGCPTSSG